MQFKAVLRRNTAPSPAGTDRPARRSQDAGIDPDPPHRVVSPISSSQEPFGRPIQGFEGWSLAMTSSYLSVTHALKQIANALSSAMLFASMLQRRPLPLAFTPGP
jgi:hypothetical protein